MSTAFDERFALGKSGKERCSSAALLQALGAVHQVPKEHSSSEALIQRSAHLAQRSSSEALLKRSAL